MRPVRHRRAECKGIADVVKLTSGDKLVNRLDLGRRDHYAGGSMPSTIASAVPTPIISFAIFAAHLRS